MCAVSPHNTFPDFFFFGGGGGGGAFWEIALNLLKEHSSNCPEFTKLCTGLAIPCIYSVFLKYVLIINFLMFLLFRIYNPGQNILKL